MSEQKNKPKVDEKEVERLLSMVGDSILIQDRVEAIKADLEVRGLPIEGNSIKILTKHLAATQLLLILEKIHTSIFGSQIYLLKRLNESIPEGKSDDFIHAHIDYIKSIYDEHLSSWDYEQYLAFLFEKTLITKGEKHNLHITNLGVEYLTWMSREGRKENNPL